MKTLICWLAGHRWGPWSAYRPRTEPTATCKRCGREAGT